MGHWYKILTKDVHTGAGKEGDQIIYMWDDYSIKVLKRYKRLRGVPKHAIPDIIELTPEGGLLVEKAIVEDRKWDVERAKRYCVRYYLRRGEIPPA